MHTIHVTDDGHISDCGKSNLMRYFVCSRNLGSPMLKLTGHSHWIWNCLYNPSHSTLLLSSSSDSLVVLWSNAPLGSSPDNLPSSPVRYDKTSPVESSAL